MQKTENGQTTYYLRSSVLGGQVVAELNGSGAWQRGYVYVGGQLLAVQAGGAVRFEHEDPVTKAKQETDAAGAVSSSTVVDPWGGEAAPGWQQNSAQQRRKYTTYGRDGHNRDEAMQRQYSGWYARFTQPDPSDSSYDLSDPRSLNRYAYVRNDPVNYVDPSGLNLMSPDYRPPDDLSKGTGILSPGFHTLTYSWDNGRVEGAIDLAYRVFTMEFHNGAWIVSSSSPLVGGELGGGGATVTPPPQPNPVPEITYLDCFARCCEMYRLDNTIREIGEAAGYPTVGEVVADMTNTALVASMVNEVLNLSPLGRYPRQGVRRPAGSPTTWQHRAAQIVRQNATGMRGTRSISNFGKATGQFASKVAYPILFFEAGHAVGTIGYCAARCRNPKNRRHP